jgi:hypothetical protein
MMVKKTLCSAACLTNFKLLTSLAKAPGTTKPIKTTATDTAVMKS